MSVGGTPGPGLIPAILAGLTLRGSGLLNGRPPRGTPANAPRDPDGPGYETRDVGVRNTALVMAGLALAVLTVIGTMVWLMGAFSASQRRTLPTLTRQQTAPLTPPPPNLQADPYADLDRQRAEAAARLAGYGYSDPARTRARIPIDRAMDLIVGRPLDAPDR
ncbi:hypothetical protein MKK67_16360 [Methylobacterium sp. J-072]|uniref:hypothetical protein n=1 Tax=Methylobacterium sp. J-072 TaxID=2836651 RepID=UPI001FB8C201|nr:hypothetical protein [Methylobacterium sp. J-072]MCJ2094053.1 hypothetical protein [Methylobacterium sp. J-072]